MAEIFDNSELDGVCSDIAKETLEITHDDFIKGLMDEIINENLLFQELKNIIEQFLRNVEDFELLEQKSKSEGNNISTVVRLLEIKKELLYTDFFKIQNMINLLKGQKIVMTYVHVDENGEREIRVSENDISHLVVSEGQSRGNPFIKLTYDVQDHYKILKNSLPQEENIGLQEAAKEVEKRYLEHKKRVLWFYPNAWKGYRFYSKGPINEAYVNFYVHNIKLTNSLEGNIDTFILSPNYGAINADATKGFMIGDISRGPIQYAVKGAFGSPQGIKEVVKSLKKLKDENFSSEAYLNFINHYTEEERVKQYSPQIKELSKQSISQLKKYLKLDKNLQYNLTM